MQRQQVQAEEELYENQDKFIQTESIYSQNSQTSKTTRKDFSKQRLKFTIISQQSTNQILQFVLMPNQTVYHKGQIIYANQQQPQITLKYLLGGIQTKIKQFTSSKNFNLNKLSNQGIDFNYYGIRSQRGGGKILILDSLVYDHYFYIQQNRVLLSNLSNENGQFKTHQKMPGFIRGKPKQNAKDIDAFYVVQAQINSSIIQKSLGDREKFSCKLKNLIAFTNNVKVTRKGKSQWVSFQGPGWVFVGNNPQQDSDISKGSGFIKPILFGYLIMVLITAIFQAIALIQGNLIL